jgi:hypothetical protein
MKKIFIIISILTFVIAGCKKENELKKSVFIKDPDNPDLPVYSEWGYNTFGAYYDRQAFISNNRLVPAKISVSGNSMSFILDGQKGGSDYYYNYQEMIMTFKLQGFSPQQYSNLIALNDTTFDLKNAANQVLITIDTIKYNVSVISGELQFKRAQNLQVDKNPIEVILSGYFEFKALVNDKPVTISDGRFDVGISPDNFYNN